MNNNNNLNCEKRIVGIMGIVEPAQNALGIEIWKCEFHTDSVGPSLHFQHIFTVSMISLPEYFINNDSKLKYEKGIFNCEFWDQLEMNMR